MKRDSLLWGAALALAAASPAAALMVEVPFEQLAASSSAVVRARVVGIQSSWIAHPRIIVTDVTLAVDEVWAGALTPGQPLMLRVEGGTVGDVTLEVEHEPAFAPGEEVVLFLRETPSARLAVHHAEQGKFGVVGGQAVGIKQQPIALKPFRAEVERLRQGGQR